LKFTVICSMRPCVVIRVRKQKMIDSTGSAHRPDRLARLKVAKKGGVEQS
jgi:hypothetical protein